MIFPLQMTLRRIMRACLLTALATHATLALSASAAEQTVVVRTESPRATLESFVQLRDTSEAAIARYWEQQNRTNFRHLLMLTAQFAELLDLSSVPAASRDEVASDTMDALLDIIGRKSLPSLATVPDAEAFDEDGAPAQWRVPGTPIRIMRVDDGPREGEFLFAARTVEVAPQFLGRIRHLPLQTSLGFDSWTDAMAQIHGPMIPAGLVFALPDSLKQSWLHTPIWKVLTTVALGLLTAIVLILWDRWVNRRPLHSAIGNRLRRLLTPILTVIGVVLVLEPLIAFEVNVSGSFARAVETATTVVVYLSVIWIFWATVVVLFDWSILSPRIPEKSLDANLMRLSARVIGFLGGVFILAYGAHDLGVPIVGLVTSLGVGGLAVALAIRPTLENLIGGLILYTDKPVSVGDFCSFGANTGTVENIGVRSTQVRALDRTVISVPNAAFADMEIVNWARCDMMRIQTTIGVRYETEPDQLRYLLATLREMLYAHPKIDNDTVRVRFFDYGASSLEVQIRAYALTREWNEYFAIREDVFLRVNQLVAESGTSFAFPSQTLYLGRDGGLDEERSHSAMASVAAWRRAGQLPFPTMAAAKAEALAGTLDYPPYGSPGTEATETTTEDESLSMAPEPDSAGAKKELPERQGK